MSVSASTAYLLVFHGSQDPRPGQAMERLAQFVRLQLQQSQEVSAAYHSTPPGAHRGTTLTASGQRIPSAAQPPNVHPECPPDTDLDVSKGHPDWRQYPLVGTACLELGILPLHQQLINFSRRAHATGVKTVRVVPLFLAKGVHVMEDIPAEVQKARQSLTDITLEMCAHVGSHPGLRKLLKRQLQGTAAEDVLLLAHGSRRPGGNGGVNTVARFLGASPTFWAIDPNLESQVIQHMQNGAERLTILPYFLFSGRITDAITRLTEELAERFPQLSIHLLPPIGPSPELATLVTDLALNKTPKPDKKSAVPMKRVAFRHYAYSSMVS
jgi:sirohydrochlorin cobaltochelatase